MTERSGPVTSGSVLPTEKPQPAGPHRTTRGSRQGRRHRHSRVPASPSELCPPAHRPLSHQLASRRHGPPCPHPSGTALQPHSSRPGVPPGALAATMSSYGLSSLRHRASGLINLRNSKRRNTKRKEARGRPWAAWCRAPSTRRWYQVSVQFQRRRELGEQGASWHAPGGHPGAHSEPAGVPSARPCPGPPVYSASSKTAACRPTHTPRRGSS